MRALESSIKNVAWLIGLILLGSGSGLIANKLGERNTRYPFPAHIPWQQKWTNRVLEEAQKMGVSIFDTEQTAQAIETGEMWIVDGRKLAKYDSGHIPTAIPLPVSQFETEFVNFPALPDEPVLIYCSGANCDESLLLARKLHEQGHTNLTIYVGGFDEWTKAQQPIE